MSTEYITPQEWIEKADYEGGIYAGFEYGLNESSIDRDKYPVFYRLIQETKNDYRVFEMGVEDILNYNESDEEYNR